MKKLYLIPFILFSAALSQAQTITRDNLPVAGDIYSSVYVNSEPIWDAGSAGDNQTWDFSNFTGDVVPYEYMTVTNPAFSNSEMKLGLSNLGDLYFAGSQDDYRLTGMTNSFDGASLDIPYSDEQVLFKFPMMFQDTFKDTALASYSGTIVYNNFPVPATTKRYTYSETTVDGRGTLVMSNFTYENVLRVKVAATIYDTVSANNFPYEETAISNTEEYYFFSQDYKHQIAYFMRFTSTVQADPIELIFTFSNPVVLNTVDVKSVTETLAYPNPADNNVKYDLKEAASVEIFDIHGRLTASGNFEMGENSLDISSLSPGVYNYRVMYKSGEVSYGKVTVK